MKLWLANFVLFGSLFVVVGITFDGDGNPYISAIWTVIVAALMASFLKWRQIPSAANRWFGETSTVQRPWRALAIYTATVLVGVYAMVALFDMLIG